MSNMLSFYFLLFAVWFGQGLSSDPTCGSLITYRQYSILLRDAPRCFKEGCGLPPNSTLSDTCPAKLSCAELWSTISQHARLNWCLESRCRDNLACRTRGWPIVNATQFCQSIPNDWMYISSECCSSNEQPFDIARWIKRQCTQDWRSNFTFYGGMAREDWLEYIVPWNWTTHYDNSTGKVKKAPVCHRPSYYLGMFALESIAIWFALFLVPFLQIFFHYSDKWEIMFPPFRTMDSGTLKKLKLRVSSVKFAWSRFKKVLFWPPRSLWACLHKKEVNEESKMPDVLQALLMAFVWAGLSVGITVANTYYMKAAPGFEHVPSGQLALLWFARPNFSWITCAVGLFNREWMVKILSRWSKDSKDIWVVGLFTRVAYSAAISELIMEGLGAYALGSTVNTGRIREFYISHHLYQYYRGHAARRMYNGALVWAIVMPILFGFWAFASWTLGKSVTGLQKLMANSRAFKDRDSKRLAKLIASWFRKSDETGNTTTASSLPSLLFNANEASGGKINRPYRPPNFLQRIIGRYIICGRLRRWLGNVIPEGRLRTFVRRHILRAPLGESTQRSLSRMKSIHARLGSAEENVSLSLLQDHEGVEGRTLNDTIAPRDRKPRPMVTATPIYDLQQILPSQDISSVPMDGYEYCGRQPESDPFLSSAERHKTSTSSYRMDPEPVRSEPKWRGRPRTPTIEDREQYVEVPLNDTTPSRPAPGEVSRSSVLSPFTDPQYEYSDEGAPGTTSTNLQLNAVDRQELSAASQYEPEMPNPKKLTWAEVVLQWEKDRKAERAKYAHVWESDDIRRVWMLLALILGFISYISQWMFWEGYVNVAGDRYCPPGIGYITTFWVLSAFGGVTITFLGNM